MASRLPHSKDIEILRLKQYQERYRKERKKNQALRKQLREIEKLLEQKEMEYGRDWLTFTREDVMHIRNLIQSHNNEDFWQI